MIDDVILSPERIDQLVEQFNQTSDANIDWHLAIYDVLVPLTSKALSYYKERSSDLMIYYQRIALIDARTPMFKIVLQYILTCWNDAHIPPGYYVWAERYTLNAHPLVVPFAQFGVVADEILTPAQDPPPPRVANSQNL